MNNQDKDRKEAVQGPDTQKYLTKEHLGQLSQLRLVQRMCNSNCIPKPNLRSS